MTSTHPSHLPDTLRHHPDSRHPQETFIFLLLDYLGFPFCKIGASEECLCTCVVSLHCGWARVGLCDCRIVALVAFVWILSSVCFAVISHERLFRWKSCIGCTYGHRQQGQEFRMTLLEAKIGFIHCIGNSFGEETTEVLCQRMSGDLFNEIMFLSDVIWSRD